MTRAAIGIAVAGAALVIAAGADAKGVQSVKLCGASGCTETQQPLVGVAFADSKPSDPPSAPMPFMRALVRFQEPVPAGQNPPKHPRTVPVWFVVIPAQHLIRSRETSSWLRIEDPGGLREFLARVRPYPASEFPGWLRRDLRSQQAQSQPPNPESLADGSFPWLWALLGTTVAGALTAIATLRLRRRAGAAG
jgi:hypothetical protein